MTCGHGPERRRAWAIPWRDPRGRSVLHPQFRTGPLAMRQSGTRPDRHRRRSDEIAHQRTGRARPLLAAVIRQTPAGRAVRSGEGPRLRQQRRKRCGLWHAGIRAARATFRRTAKAGRPARTRQRRCLRQLRFAPGQDEKTEHRSTPETNQRRPRLSASGRRGETKTGSLPVFDAICGSWGVAPLP